MNKRADSKWFSDFNLSMSFCTANQYRSSSQEWEIVEDMHERTPVSCEVIDESQSGLALTDSIDRHRYVLYTSVSVTPRPIDTDVFEYPVDYAAEIRTEAITLPSIVGINVRDCNGEVLMRTAESADESFPARQYTLELSAPLKIYLNIEGSIHITSDITQTRIDFGSETTVCVGARSHHQSPAATITTTDDPVDMMCAISAFSSALKTTGVDRSYPSLRGHPPAIERGEYLSIPSELDGPATGITIEIPPEYRFVYVVSSLAYYLGATVVPGTTPRITTSEFEHRLDPPDGFEREVERVLKQVFFLDCLTRTEGDSGIHLHERRILDSVLDLPLKDLYEQSLSEQLESYLSVPFADIEPYLPEWKVTSHVSPSPDSVEAVPFLVNDLAVIKTPQAETVSSRDEQSEAISEFLRDGALTRSTTDSTSLDRDYVQPESDDSLEQVWVGDETPLGASKATATAFRNRLQRSPTDGDITITVVCNEQEMDEERNAIDTVYGSREDLPFDVRVHRELTTDELAIALTSQADFFHYIGHVDPDGFRCSDGLFDARTLDSVGMDAFFLNACQSYEQGMALIDAGAIGGGVTLGNVLNSGAFRIGRTMAGLLNRGFPLRPAMDIASDESLIGHEYLVVGDGGLAIAQAETQIPMLGEIERMGDDQFELTLNMYPPSAHGMGSVVRPLLEDEKDHHLASGGIETYELRTSELEQFLGLEQIPVKVKRDLKWSDDVTLTEL
jgi:hypothetical protein